MPTGTILLDTGPLVAALARNDPLHATSLTLLTRHIGDCVTSEAVVTEATHLVGRGRADAWIPLEMLLAAGVPVRGLESRDHRSALGLMMQYRDTGMDYADATLLVLAETMGIRRILTHDRRGFSVFQVGGAPLEIVT